MHHSWAIQFEGSFNFQGHSRQSLSLTVTVADVIYNIEPPSYDRSLIMQLVSVRCISPNNNSCLKSTPESWTAVRTKNKLLDAKQGMVAIEMCIGLHYTLLLVTLNDLAGPFQQLV